MYGTAAVSLIGRPSAQALFEIAPRLPCAGGVTIENVSSQSFRSAPLRVTFTAVSCSVAADTSAALGGAGLGSVVVVGLAMVVVVIPGVVAVVVVTLGAVVVVTGSVTRLTAAASSGATTVLPYGSPRLVGCAVGTVNCHCWASISVSASGDCRLSGSLLKK